MFNRCPKPIWINDDYTQCFQTEYLRTVLPISFCVLSILLLGYHIFYISLHGQSRFDSNVDTKATDVPYTDDPHDILEGQVVEVIKEEKDQQNVYIKISEQKGGALVIYIEALLIIGQLILHIIMHRQGNESRTKSSSAIGLAFWTYSFLLVVSRIILYHGRKMVFSKIWWHTTYLYIGQWLCTVIIFRSAILYPISSHYRKLEIVNFNLVTALLIIALISRQGNEIIKIRYEDDIPPNLEGTASLLRSLTLSWMDPLIFLGYKKTLEGNDVFNLREENKAANSLSAFEQGEKSRSFILRLLLLYKWQFIRQFIWAAIFTIATVIPALILHSFLKFVENPSKESINVAWLYIILMFVTSIIGSIAEGQALQSGRRLNASLRAIIVGEVNAKALRRQATAVSDKDSAEQDDENEDSRGLFSIMFGKAKAEPKKKSQASTGKIYNLMTVDAPNVADSAGYIMETLIRAPICLILALTFLYKIVGWSSIAGLIIMLVVLPVNFFLARLYNAYQGAILLATDQRVSIINEVVTNIRLVKFFAWEQRFAAIIDEKRMLELRKLRKRLILRSFDGAIFWFTPFLITAGTFGCYTLIEKKVLTPSVAFPALALLDILKFPLEIITDTTSELLNTYLSLKRVSDFLDEEETHKLTQLKDQSDDHVSIGFERSTFTWSDDRNSTSFKLMDLDIDFKVGQLNLVMGQTGSGKSSLLMALLGEMNLLKGKVFLPGARSRDDVPKNPKTGLQECVAYCAQQAWLSNATVKQNIVFSSPWDPKRYKKVIEACALVKDFAILHAGDNTLVGEKGVTLSGGQKQRVSIARALYSPARHLLLDDVLSAVDSHTSEWIFNRAILGPLIEDRTCILISHNIAMCLPKAKFVVLLENGRIISQGSFEEVVASGKLPEIADISRQVSDTQSINIEAIGEDNEAEGEAIQEPFISSMEEKKAEGRVKSGVYLTYIVAMGGFTFWILALTAFLTQQLIDVALTVWIKEWSSAGTDEENHVHSQHGPLYYLTVHLILALSTAVVGASQTLAFAFGSLTASKTLHTKLLNHVLYAKFSFFDNTPLGQIMNRFSKDMISVDQELQKHATHTLDYAINLVMVVIVISVLLPQFLLAGLVITFIFGGFGFVYISAARDLKRLMSVSYSPLFQQVSEVLSGIVTIRAYSDEKRYIRENMNYIDVSNRPFLYMWASNRWLACRIETAGALVAFSTGSFILLGINYISAGTAGLAMTYALLFTDRLLWLVRTGAETEQNMNSVERLKEYFESEQEAPAIILNTNTSPDWPRYGNIKLENYSARYKPDLDCVLKNIHLEIKAGEKIGVVGRTGAGKSSLALALLRSLEADTGKIVIDGVDISKIGLKELRENIVVVPQDPTLFSGTVRTNLDPFNLYTDDEIFDALKSVHLLEIDDNDNHDAIESNKNPFLSLSYGIATSGTNLSQGQRQLLCLARAMLLKPKILIMDEATASIDHETDLKIQGTIRELSNETKDGTMTIITIAHRLRTVIDYDRIVVLDLGQVVEIGEPWTLISKKEKSDDKSWFRDLCEQSGEIEYLKGEAENSSKKKL